MVGVAIKGVTHDMDIILPTDCDWTLDHVSAWQQYVLACALRVALDSCTSNTTNTSASGFDSTFCVPLLQM